MAAQEQEESQKQQSEVKKKEGPEQDTQAKEDESQKRQSEPEGEGKEFRAEELQPPPSLGRDPDWEKVREMLEEAIREHNTTWDAWMYNGGTVVILLVTAVATILPSVLGADSSLSWLSQALTAFVGFLVALERSLSFGQRWMFHNEMKSGYRWIKAMILFYECLPNDQKPKYLTDIWNDLYTLKRRESMLPGVTTSKA